MGLEKYRAKRKFDKTPEPRGGEGVEGVEGRRRFVIHKHQARSLHYDLRLEMNGVLRSWAVPKQPPARKGIKRLAVQVEDHPVDYIDFFGVIPQGNYGAGKVEIWDRGAYQEIKKSRNLRQRRIRLGRKKIKDADSFKFELRGKKLKGEYALVKLKDGKSWLLFKTG